MDWLTIQGVPPWDGRYEFDMEGRELTTREWGWLKRLSGYMPLTIDAGFRGGDPELFAVFAVIALHRAGRITAADAADIFERFSDAPFGATVTLETDQPDTGGEAAPDPSASSPANAPDSGPPSETSSETWAGNHQDTGMLASAISELAPTRSET